MKKSSVLLLILALFFVVCFIDVLLLVSGSPTISNTITFYTFDKKIVFAPMLLGVLIGHFFVRLEKPLFNKWYIIATCFLITYLIFQLMYIFLPIHPILFVLMSIPAGFIFWSQKNG